MIRNTLRDLEDRSRHTLDRGKSVLLLGARQTGKTTLVQRFKYDMLISFLQPDVRQRYEKSPHLLKGEVESLELKVSGRRIPQRRTYVIWKFFFPNISRQKRGFLFAEFRAMLS